MQSLRQIKSRIASIGNTGKLTRAMEMVSVSKLKSIQRSLSGSRQYFVAAERILANLLAGFEAAPHPLLQKREVGGNITLCVIASDTGLCGSYNNSVLRMAEDFMRKNSGSKIDLVCVGRKAFSHFRRQGLEPAASFTDLYGRYIPESFQKISQLLVERFLGGKADEVYVSYAYFDTTARYRPALEKFLGVELPAGQEVRYILEPDINFVLSELIPRYVLSRFECMMLSSFASEHSARVIAMGEASDNAEELLGELILMRNKVRQANITKELIEVISTVEALRG